MNPTPTIKITQDLQQEVEVFMKFLNHPDFPQNRTNIFNVHNNLETQILTDGEKRAVTEYIETFYEKNQSKIKEILDQCEKSLKDADKALHQLGKIMEYKWPEGENYKAYPTILPFSPFSNKEFNFSILNTLGKDEPVDVMYIAVHEISHFVFLDQLYKIENNHNIKFHKDLIYYYKEALTTVILNEPNLKTFFGEKEIKGNPDIRDINVKINGEAITLINYLKQEFEKENNYSDFLEKTLLRLHAQENEFSKKREIWNQNGHMIFNDNDLLSKYREAILI